MAHQVVQVRYGTNTAINSVVLAIDELVFNRTTGSVHVGDGVTAGGGYILPGRAAPDGPLYITTNDSVSTRGIISKQVSSDASAAQFMGFKSRGVVGAETTIANADFITSLVADPYDGSSFFNSGAIAFKVNGTVSTNVVPTDFLIYTTTTNSLTERVRVLSSGEFGIGDSAPGFRLTVNNGSLASQARFYGSGATTGGGIHLTTTSDNNALVSGGASFNGSSWVARGTIGTIFGTNATGEFTYFSDSGLTPGNTFTPTIVMRLAPTLLTMINGAFKAVAQASLFGSAAGNYTSPTHTNTNLLLYDNSATNWAGIGADTSGNMYFVTGISAPVARLLIDITGGISALTNAFFTAGSNAGFFAYDRAANGRFGGLYRQSDICRIYSSVFGDVISYTDTAMVGIGGISSPANRLQIVSADNLLATDIIRFNFDVSNNYRSGIGVNFNGSAASLNTMRFRVCDGTTTGQNTVLTLYGDAHASFASSVGMGIATPRNTLELYSAGTTGITITDSSVGTDIKSYDWIASGGNLSGRLINDAYNVGVSWMQITRSTTTVDQVKHYGTTHIWYSSDTGYAYALLTNGPAGTQGAQLSIGLQASTGYCTIKIGHGRTGSGYAYIDLVGDTTYTDYGLRVIRANSGANAESEIDHRGTGSFKLVTVDSASLVFATASTNRYVVGSSGGLYSNGATGGDKGVDTINVGTYYSNNVVFGALSGNYIYLSDGSNQQSIFLGGSGDPTNYYRNTSHLIGNIGGSVTYLAINATNAAFVVNAIPNADNTYSCGMNGFRWTAVWAVNGTIQTSDGRDKTAIYDSDLGLDFICSLRPVKFKWKTGSNKVIDQIPIRNKSGHITGHEMVIESQPGRRIHYGLIAQDVKRALDDYKVEDFGGWVLTDPNNPDSEQALRPDQFIAPLIKSVQELYEVIKIQGELIDELKQRLN